MPSHPQSLGATSGAPERTTSAHASPRQTWLVLQGLTLPHHTPNHPPGTFSSWESFLGASSSTFCSAADLIIALRPLPLPHAYPLSIPPSSHPSFMHVPGAGLHAHTRGCQANRPQAPWELQLSASSRSPAALRAPRVTLLTPSAGTLPPGWLWSCAFTPQDLPPALQVSPACPQLPVRTLQ